MPGALAATTSATLTATPASSGFGTVVLGTKNTQTIQVKYSGTAGLIMTGSISGSGFSFSGLQVPLQLAPGGVVSFEVAFAPIAVGSVNGTMTLKNELGATMVTIGLSGTGVAPFRKLTLSHSSLVFGNEMIGKSTNASVTLTNAGNISVKISGVTVSGTGFTVTGGASGATLSAGQSASIGVTFAPKISGSFSGRVAIASNASSSPETIALSGTGLSEQAAVQPPHLVTLSWHPGQSSGVSGYYVYRSTVSGKNFIRINAAPTIATQFTDTTVAAGVTYYYVVTAVALTGAESAHSSQVTATVP